MPYSFCIYYGHIVYLNLLFFAGFQLGLLGRLRQFIYILLEACSSCSVYIRVSACMTFMIANRIGCVNG